MLHNPMAQVTRHQAPPREPDRLPCLPKMNPNPAFGVNFPWSPTFDVMPPLIGILTRSLFLLPEVWLELGPPLSRRTFNGEHDHLS